MQARKLICESTLTDRYQTTIPDIVRKALNLHKRDRICYSVQPNGQVVVSRVEENEEDPALGHFLSFLAKDISQNPQHVKAVGTDLYDRIHTLVADVEVDLDSPLLDEDE